MNPLTAPLLGTLTGIGGGRPTIEFSRPRQRSEARAKLRRVGCNDLFCCC